MNVPDQTVTSNGRQVSTCHIPVPVAYAHWHSFDANLMMMKSGAAMMLRTRAKLSYKRELE